MGWLLFTVVFLDFMKSRERKSKGISSADGEAEEEDLYFLDEWWGVETYATKDNLWGFAYKRPGAKLRPLHPPQQPQPEPQPTPQPTPPPQPQPQPQPPHHVKPLRPPHHLRPTAPLPQPQPQPVPDSAAPQHSLLLPPLPEPQPQPSPSLAESPSSSQPQQAQQPQQEPLVSVSEAPLASELMTPWREVKSLQVHPSEICTPPPLTCTGLPAGEVLALSLSLSSLSSTTNLTQRF